MTRYINFGDVIDLYLKIKTRGIRFVSQSLLKFSAKKRVQGKWDHFVTSLYSIL